jgi:hypothetical protein
MDLPEIDELIAVVHTAKEAPALECDDTGCAGIA